MKIFVSILFMTIVKSWSHGGIDHSVKKNSSAVQIQENKVSYKSINESYINSIKPIFKKACFDCHSNKANYPWYYNVPGIKQLIDSDIKEAKSHLEFGESFPFKSHENPINDLKSIAKSIKNESMPPFNYRVMHSKSRLSNKEILEVEKWVKESLIKLK